MKGALLVFIGGGCGSVLRYLLSVASLRWVGTSAFPIATLMANIIGCLLFGLIAARMSDVQWRLLLLSGFCGGFTTFSAFAAENFLLWEQQHYTLLASYTAASIIFGLAAAALGFYLAR